MKLVKIKFTAWRDSHPALRSPAFQQRLDALTTRLTVLFRAAARNDRQAWPNSEALQKEVAAITAESQQIDAERASLFAAEDEGTERKRLKVGTFGYQVLNDAGTRVTKIVYEAGNDLPAKAVYSYEVVDDEPPLPKWAKEGRFGG